VIECELSKLTIYTRGFIMFSVPHSSIGASFSGDGSPALPGGNGNTPLATFGTNAGIAFQDALNAIRDRLPKSLSMPEKIRKEDRLEKLHLGFDTLEWSAEISEEELTGAMPELEYLAANDEPLDIDGLEVVVRRVGGISHCYLISTSLGLSVWVPKKPMYRLRVVASPKYILSQETDDLEERAAILVASLARLDAIPVLMLSRVDVALDLLMPVSRFENIVKRVATKDQSVVRRARLLVARSEGDSYRSVQVGKSDVVLRIYDKMTEAIKTGDWDLWRKVYGEPNIPEDYTVVRVEFQQRTGFLKQSKDSPVLAGSDGGDVEVPLFPDGLRSLAVYRAAAPATLLYLTQAWFRFAGSKKGADNVRSTLGWWQSISNLFVVGDWYHFAADVWRDCRRVASKNLDRLVSMSAGCLSAVAAVLSYRAGGEKVGVRDVLKHMFDYLMDDDGDVDRYERWVEGRDKRYQSLRFGVRM
jgi:hypothetical protein